MLIKDKLFVISGGASGLGRATAIDLHSQGGYIAILDMHTKNGDDTVKKLGAERTKFFQVDVSNSDSVTSAVQGTIEWSKKIGKDIVGVITAAGVGFPSKVIDRKGEPVPLTSFDCVLNVNLRGTVDLIRQLLPTMVQNKPFGSAEGDGERGVLVMVSSIAAYDGQTGQLAYSASKGAVASMTLPMARDLAPYGIRVVTIAPGMFASTMTSMMSDKVRKSLEAVFEFPSRIGKAEEFASLVREVIRNKMLNAAVLRLDGGMRMPSKI